MPFFPGTPVETDYGEIAQTMQEALNEIAVNAN
jgi:hypothetical protein